jgi:NAD+ synthase
MTQTAPDILRIAVAQLNPTVGDVAGNLAKAREARADAARQGADLVLYTELFLAGYPPEDLVLKPAFLKACEKAAQDIAKDTADGGPGVIIGTPLKRKSGTHNSIVFADGGKIIAERYKLDLPNYGEFDEKRVFQAGPELQGPVNFRGVRLGVPICEVNLKAEIEIMALHEKLDELRHSEIIGMRDEILRMAEQIRRIDEKLSARSAS